MNIHELLSGLFKPGDIFDGKYRIIAKLGAGAFGTVYSAWHEELERTVAIKLLSGEAASDEKLRTRLLQEAQICSTTLNHENIVKVLSFGVLPDGRPYLVMEHIEGTTLFPKAPTPWIEVVDISLHVLSGLEHAHSNNIIHRDLKPGNVFICANNEKQAKILDFGLAKCLYGSTKLTATGFANGTPNYMSPEQALGRQLDGRSDIYSWACVMYEMLAGKQMFGYDDAIAIMYKHVNEPPPPIPDIPAQLQTVLDVALAKDPTDRYDSASAFKAALQSLKSGELDSQTKEKQGSARRLIAKPIRPVSFAGFTVLFVLMCSIVLSFALSQTWLVSVLPPLFIGQKSQSQYEHAADLCLSIKQRNSAAILFKKASDRANTALDKYDYLVRAADCYQSKTTDSNDSSAAYGAIWSKLISDFKDNGEFEKLKDERDRNRFFDIALHVYRRAGPLDETLATATKWLGHYLMAAGRTEEGESLSLKALRALPDDASLIYQTIGTHYVMKAGKAADMKEQQRLLNKSLSYLDLALKSSNDFSTHFEVGSSYVVGGQEHRLPAGVRIKMYKHALEQFRICAPSPFRTELVPAQAAACWRELQSLETMSFDERIQYLKNAVSEYEKAAAMSEQAGKFATAAGFRSNMAECYRMISGWQRSQTASAYSRLAAKELVAAAEDAVKAMENPATRAEACQCAGDCYKQLSEATLGLPAQTRKQYLGLAIAMYKHNIPADGRMLPQSSNPQLLNSVIRCWISISDCYQRLATLSTNDVATQDRYRKEAQETITNIFRALQSPLKIDAGDNLIKLTPSDYYRRLATMEFANRNDRRRLLEKALVAIESAPNAIQRFDHYFELSSICRATANMLPLTNENKQRLFQRSVDALLIASEVHDLTLEQNGALREQLSNDYLTLSALDHNRDRRTKDCEEAIKQAQLGLQQPNDVDAVRRLHDLMACAYFRIYCCNTVSRHDALDKSIQERRLEFPASALKNRNEKLIVDPLPWACADDTSLSREEVPAAWRLASDLYKQDAKNTTNSALRSLYYRESARSLFNTTIGPTLTPEDRRKYFQAALELSEEAINADSRGENRCLNELLLASLFRTRGEFDQDERSARADYKRAIRESEVALVSASPHQFFRIADSLEKNDPDEIKIFATRFRAMTFYKMGNLPVLSEKERIQYYDEAIKDFEWVLKSCRQRSKKYPSDVCYYLGLSLIGRGNVGQPFERSGYYEKAMHVLAESIETGEPAHMSCIALGRCEIAVGNLEKGRDILERARRVFVRQDWTDNHARDFQAFLSDTARFLSDADPKTSKRYKREFEEESAAYTTTAPEVPSEKWLRASSIPIKCGKASQDNKLKQ